MNEAERQKYYVYDMARPSTMVHHNPPKLDEHFNRELLKLGGKDIFGDPILRIVWAASIPEVKYHETPNGKTEEYHGKRYAYMKRSVVTGYTYINDKGHKVTVKHPSLVPKNKIYSNSSYLDELGIMKWVVEMKYSASDLEALGYYPKLGSTKAEQWCVRNGQRYRIKPSRTGEYLKAFFIETPESFGQGNFGYRDVRQSDIEEVKRIWYQAQNESDDAYAERKMKEIEEYLEYEQLERDRKQSSALESAIIRAEKAPIERVFFLPKLKEQ
jgi:hypothetical protein